MTHRTCTNCKKKQPITNYYRDNRSTNHKKIRHRTVCKSCYYAKVKKKRGINREYVKSVKENSSCSKCGYSKKTHPDFTSRALEFHHTNDDKDFNIGRISAKGRSMENLKKEIDKCIILCSRCHKEIHAKEKI
jgi:hypothetical protein